MVNIMVIGIGNHARRIYLPALRRLAERFPIKVVAGIDLKEREELIKEYVDEKKMDLDVYYVDQVDDFGNLSSDTYNILTEIARRKEVNGVVISTDPLSHRAHAEWAMSQGLNILMDKPITTRKRVVGDMAQARGIEEDYVSLLGKYIKLQQKKTTIFSINTQRRYELGYNKVFSLISEARDRFNVPVTSIQAMHSDGVWIFPDEVVDQMVHPYSQGYGKVSHSGYHLFDIVWKFYLAGKVEDKFPDTGEVFTSFLMPDGLLEQMNQNDYANYFKDYGLKTRREVDELELLYKEFGEIDAFSIVRLLKDTKNICNISINLLHNSFSRRAWSIPANDLYKGNGRVKHQFYHIQQGPFQCIQIHNYQANDKQDTNNDKEYELGGNNHFDINVFRNSGMFGGDTPTLQTYTPKDLDVDNIYDGQGLHHEQAKDAVLIEFVKFMMGQIQKSDLKSNIDSHAVSVKIMSSIYRSHVGQALGKNSVARFRI